jgi:hypothetical protein
VLGARLAKTLADQGISKLYLSGHEVCDEEKNYTPIDAFPERHSGNAFEAEVIKGKMKIPKNLIAYTHLEKNKVTIIGMPGKHGNYLEIWNTAEIEKFTEKPMTVEQMENIARLLSGDKP